MRLFARVSSSHKDDGHPRYHYSTRVTLRANLPKPVRHSLPTELFALRDDSLSGADLYQDGTLFHGPHFHGVKRVFSLSKTHVAMECLLPKVSEADQGQFPFQTLNPFVNDAIVQSLLIWTQRHLQSPCLPSYLEKLEHYKPIPFDRPCLVDLRIVSQNDFAAVADIWVTDPQGDLLLKFNGLQGTISASLKRLLNTQTMEVSAEKR